MTLKFKRFTTLFIIILSMIIMPSVYAASGFSVENINVDSKSGTIEVVDPVLSSNEVTSLIKFNQKDDYVTFNLTIKNNYNEPYSIQNITDNNSNNKFSISYNYPTDFIQPNETTNVQITFKYNDTVKNVDAIDINDLTITLSLVNEEGETKGDDIINPTTKDSILKYLIWLIIAFVGIVLSLIFIKNDKAKGIVALLCLSVLIIPIVIRANEEIEFSVKFTNIELVGEYETYEIQIKDKDGNVVETRSIKYGEKIGTLSHADVTGYDFDKYVDQNGNEVTEDTIITGPIEVTAKYTSHTYKIVFDKNNADAEGSMNDQTILYDQEVALTQNAYTYTGYHFVKWTTSADGAGDSYVDSASVKNLLTEGTLTLYAQWTENTNTPYVIVHKYQKINGGWDTEYAPGTGTTGITIPAPLAPRAGFTSPSQTTITIARNGQASVTYEYTRNQYTLTIVHPEYVETDKSGTYYYEEEVTIKAKERAGYDFDGWSNGDTTLETTITIGTSNINLEPLYTARTDTPYVIVHKYETLNGGWDIESVPGTGTTDTTIPAPIVPRTGFVNPTQVNITITGGEVASVTYEYLREEYSFSVTDRTYLVNTSTANGSYKYGTTITLEAQERDGYTFKWSDDVTSYSRSFTLEGNTTLSLVYTYNKYHITFNAGAGTCSEASRDITKGTAVGELPSCTHPQGRQFLGWKYNDVTINSSYVPTSDIELTASYLINDYTITFDVNGGSSVDPIVVVPGQSVNEFPTPTRDNKVFEGWYTNLTDGIKVEAPYTPEGNITLVAKWADYLCIKATSLHEVTCGHTDGTKGCRKAHSQENYEYGNIIDSDTLESGDVLDCNVDGTGYNQRFYYLRTIDNNAALISYTDFEGESGQGNTQSYVYSTALTKLPTTTQWSNLPITFEVAEGNTRAARLMTYTDLKYACGNGTSVTSADLLNCQYIFENSGFESTTTGRNGTWVAEEDGVYRRIQNSQVALETPSKGANSENTVKPVIEIPLRYINDQYIIRFDANGGTLTGNEYVRIDKGSSIGTLPEVQKGLYSLLGWYTASTGGTKISNNTIPDGYNTYYARWAIPVEDADLAKDNFILQVGESDTIIINNVDELESYEFISNDPNVASVDSDGVIMALAEGTITITINGLETQTSKTINVTVHPASTEYTVHFEENEGDPVADITVAKNTAIGNQLPSTQKSGYNFGGWWTANYESRVTEETIITSDMTLYAKWIPLGKQAEMNNEFYDTIQLALAAATDTKTTIILLEDVSYTVSVDLFDNNTTKNIVLDLNGHTLTNTSTQAIKTKTTLEVMNGTVIDTSANGTIDVGTDGHLILHDCRVENTSNRAAIYNDGGLVEIGDNVYLTSKAQYQSSKKRGTLQNVTGTTVISGKTEIYNTRSADSYAVSVIAGSLTIGNKDDEYDKDLIIMQGNVCGIYSDVDYSMYDGIAKGKTNAVNNTSKIAGIEIGATHVDGTDGDYKTYYYEINNPYYVINLEANGGTVNPTTLYVDKGQEIGSQLPTPTRGVYTFDGWYTNLTDGILVDEHTIPQGNDTYYAKWHYEASQTVDNFNMTNDVMTVYYNNIGTWKNNQSTFQDNMDANFNNYGCKCNENTCSTAGTNLCDKPNGYDTGFAEPVNVYESDENTKVKGNLVTYTTSNNGVIYNMIPGQTYYWELASDPTIYGIVKASGERRILNIDGVRNARDLGGIQVDTDGDGTMDGTIKYGILFRGERLYSDSTNVTKLAKLGVNEEIDLRGTSEIPSTEAQFPTEQYKHREIKHYQIRRSVYPDYYNMSRSLAVEAMQDVIAGKSIYFHCRIGTDRTGTLAYILEGLLGADEEEMLEDYELSYFFGLVNRHRFYATDPKSSVSKTEKFVYMKDTFDEAGGVYAWFMQGSTDVEADKELIRQFKLAAVQSLS